ncbi:nuclear transport factor 2 family protein [Zhongshania aquimaris]|uniref:SnoaL-like domain-containing protein n=1 Tax=Zhongshania aquimaris TaxID=2857107 RepID=A0ABS6VV32_9GAMM|nr:hypothetical protein [Zhongshania aquimaris]MBW2942193.1 hypothetical protein [Zhongshania aquimaris]
MTELSLDTRRAQLRAIFTKVITAYGSQDFETVEQYLTANTRFEWPYPPLEDFPDHLIGGAAFIEASKVGMAECSPYNHKIDMFYDQLDPNCLIVEYHSNSVHLKTQLPYGNRYLGILKFDGESIIFWKEYVNPLPILNVYGKDYTNSAASTEQKQK